MGKPSTLDRIGTVSKKITAAQDQSEERIKERAQLVQQARAEGFSWSEISTASGVTHQSLLKQIERHLP